MPVSETRLAVRLQDGATSGLRNLTTTYSRFSSTVANSGRSLSQFNRQVGGANLGGFASNADKAASSLSNMNKTMERLVYSASRYFVIYKAMGAVGNVWDTVVGGSLEYAKSLESNRIGIAGILKSMITLNGENVKWNDAMRISGDAMKSLQSEALRTAATSQELIETFRALLGPGLASGMSIDQITKLSTIGTNAVRSLGLPTNQYVQELRSIITEGIRPASSTLATSLGITNKDIKEAKASAEGLYAFLMKRMQGFQDAVKYTSDTVSGRIARIEEGIQVGVSKGADTLYKRYSAVLEDIADYLIPVPEKMGDKWQINPEFIKGVETVAAKIAKIAGDVTELGKSAMPTAGGIFGAGLTALDQIIDKLKYIAGFYVFKKAMPFVTDIANLAATSREAYNAETSLGRVIQGVSDNLHGRTEALRQAMTEQKAYNAEMTRMREIYAQQRIAEQQAKKQMAMSMQMAEWANNPAESWRAKNVTNLIAELQRLGVEQEKITILTKQYYDYVKTGSHAAADNIKQLVIEEERLYQAQINANKMGANWVATAESAANRAGSLASSFGGVSMAAGILADLIGQADEENKAWWESAGNAAMQAGMFATAIGGIVKAVADMIPALANGIKWLNKFANARSMAGLGVAGAVGVGIAAVIKNKYDEFERTGIATARDDFSGEKISYNFGHSFLDEQKNAEGELAKMAADMEAEAKAVAASMKNNNAISLKDYGGGGDSDSGGKSKGKGGGASSVNKAEQSAAKMKQLLADLNKETINLNGHTTAYEKVMAQATEKIASQEKEIVKAQQLGVDVSEVRNAQLEYQLAMEQKATEALQDEQLKYMKLDEDAANRIFTMGGTMEQQREVLGQRLEAHKAYLEELLASEIENKERRAQLQAELASVQKQINDNSVYGFKSGWQQALNELANQQINFKDQFVSAFGSIENSLVTLVNGAGSAKDKFKTFCQDITNTILKSMTQIIVKGLITRAIMAAIGLGGGGGGSSISLGSVDSVGSFAGTGAMWFGRAKGGSVKSGGTYLVGENGPELLQLGSQSGRVFNNRQTQAAFNGSPQNVRIELKNESGNELKAEQAGVSFDVDTMVISAVIKGVNEDRMGLRTMMKGMARA